MNFLLIGDIFGKVGRKTLQNNLKSIVEKNKIDVIVANGENISHGSSISLKHYEFLKDLKIDVITSGNHIFHNSLVLDYIDNKKDLLRPINMNSFLPGNGYYIFTKKQKKIMVTNIMGKTFMDHVNNPYQIFDPIIKEKKVDIHIVDFHGETTSEKKAFALAYDGKITCLVGTHTHVQTADNRILPKGTAFMTDLGMTGPYNSVIGASQEEIIKKEKTGLRVRFKPAEGIGQFSAAILKVNDETNKAVSISRIFIVDSEKNK